MWALFAVVVVPMRGCSIEEQPEPTAIGTWHGRFTSSDGCSNGSVRLSTSLDEDGGWSAIWDYRSESPGDPDDGAHARYVLEGGGTGAHLAMTSTDRQADVLVDGVWCNGSFLFDLDGPPSYPRRLLYRSLGWTLPPATLHGQWTATDCECTGTIEMTRMELDFTL